MATMASAESMGELKAKYRRLASIHHPDRGGDLSIMQKINKQYQAMQEKFKHNLCANDSVGEFESSQVVDDFSQLKPGDFLFVNATACEVLRVNEHSFHAVAITHNRQAVFCKKTGLGKYNHKIRASFTKLKPKTAMGE